MPTYEQLHVSPNTHRRFHAMKAMRGHRSADSLLVELLDESASFRELTEERRRAAQREAEMREAS